MNKFEEIKKKANEAFYDGPVQDDILYLLSIIEQAEKTMIVAVKHISGIAETFSEREKIPVLFQLNEALQAIRK